MQTSGGTKHQSWDSPVLSCAALPLWSFLSSGENKLTFDIICSLVYAGFRSSVSCKTQPPYTFSWEKKQPLSLHMSRFLHLNIRCWWSYCFVWAFSLFVLQFPFTYIPFNKAPIFSVRHWNYFHLYLSIISLKTFLPLCSLFSNQHEGNGSQISGTGLFSSQRHQGDCGFPSI